MGACCQGSFSQRWADPAPKLLTDITFFRSPALPGWTCSFLPPVLKESAILPQTTGKIPVPACTPQTSPGYLHDCMSFSLRSTSSKTNEHSKNRKAFPPYAGLFTEALIGTPWARGRVKIVAGELFRKATKKTMLNYPPEPKPQQTKAAQKLRQILNRNVRATSILRQICFEIGRDWNTIIFHLSYCTSVCEVVMHLFCTSLIVLYSELSHINKDVYDLDLTSYLSVILLLKIWDHFEEFGDMLWPKIRKLLSSWQQQINSGVFRVIVTTNLTCLPKLK